MTLIFLTIIQHINGKLKNPPILSQQMQSSLRSDKYAPCLVKKGLSPITLLSTTEQKYYQYAEVGEFFVLEERRILEQQISQKISVYERWQSRRISMFAFSKKSSICKERITNIFLIHFDIYSFGRYGTFRSIKNNNLP